MCLDRRAGHLSDWTDRQILRRCRLTENLIFGDSVCAPVYAQTCGRLHPSGCFFILSAQAWAFTCAFYENKRGPAGSGGVKTSGAAQPAALRRHCGASAARQLHRRTRAPMKFAAAYRSAAPHPRASPPPRAVAPRANRRSVPCRDRPVCRNARCAAATGQGGADTAGITVSRSAENDRSGKVSASGFCILISKYITICCSAFQR